MTLPIGTMSARYLSQSIRPIFRAFGQMRTKGVMKPGHTIFGLLGLLAAGCLGSSVDFDELCEASFSYQVHSDVHWQRFRSARKMYRCTDL